MIKGIDISHWNGAIDFDRVKASGVEFVIIKAGGSDKGFYTDPMFITNYNKAKAAGLFVGAYYFAGKNFRGTEAGFADAQRFIKILDGLKFEYPVYVDIEAQENRYKEEITDAAVAFCNMLESAGYFVGIYASDIAGFKNKLNHERIKSYAHWVARYGKEPEVCKNYGIWQYSSKGSVSGIVGSVDMDISAVDYAKVIKEKGFNNYPKQEKKKKKTKEA
jgi:GH25 family lysozyme M1 (1,4-beta-N-acetylmuramidase)